MLHTYMHACMHAHMQVLISLCACVGVEVRICAGAAGLGMHLCNVCLLLMFTDGSAPSIWPTSLALSP